MPTHWIAMNGLIGYLPDSCYVFDTKRAAIESLCQTFDRSPKGSFARKLARDGFVDVAEQIGNKWETTGERASISACDCAKPWIHDDVMTEEEWNREHAA